MTLQELLGIELPIIQAPMAGVQGSALAIAVSNAGGLGSLPCAMLDLDGDPQGAGRHPLRRPTRPYNVNFFCHTPARHRTRSASAAWRAALAPYFKEHGIDSSDDRDRARAAALQRTRRPTCWRSSGRRWSAFISACRPTDLLARVRACGAKVLSSATTVDEARWLEARGVDAIIAQGLEAGGHRGMFLSDDLSTQIGTLALVPQIVRAVRVPVIAAGGIADAKGVAAAMALGAAGAQVGTAYLLCPEATTSALHRAALKSDAARLTAITNVFTGRPARGIVNRLIRELGPMSDAAPEFPLATSAIAPLRARAESGGSNDFSPMWAGQNASGCKEIPAAVLTRELAG